MDEQTMKLINAPDDVIAEMLDGLIGAYPAILRLSDGTGRAVVARDGPRAGKVGIVIGGGSGHEPAFAGYVGRGLADAAAVGNVFASPSPAQVADAAREVDGGAGVLFLYGNYAGDVMNFDMAAYELSELGVEARTVLVTDDIASAPAGHEGERRGIAGGFFVFKIAGAAADEGLPLAEVERLARHANASVRSMGVALAPCSLPQTRRANFEIGPGEMEVGMGIHGEPGVERTALETADEVAGRLARPVIEELGLAAGDRVAVLVNGLGSTSQMELFILHRRVRRLLEERGCAVHVSWVGEYVTSLEMAGASVSLLKLDADLTRLLDRPCLTPGLRVGAEPKAGASSVAATGRRTTARTTASVTPTEAGGLIDAPMFRDLLRAVRDAIDDDADRLGRLDGAIGDGDHGVTMRTGWNAVAAAIGETSDESITLICERAAEAFLGAVGASAGPLYATGFRRAGRAVSDRLDLDGPALARWIGAMAEGIAERGGANPGDKTMLDAWAPAAHAAGNADADESGCLRAAADAAERGASSTSEMRATKGRAAKLGNRSIGHIDPGAASAATILRAMFEYFDDTGHLANQPLRE